MPGVIILEMMAQAGALAVLCDPELKGRVVYLVGIDSARLRKPVRPGDTLRLEVVREASNWELVGWEVVRPS